MFAYLFATKHTNKFLPENSKLVILQIFQRESKTEPIHTWLLPAISLLLLFVALTHRAFV